MAIFKGDILLAGTNPGGGSGSGGHVIQDSTGTDFDQQPNLRFIGAEVVNDDVNEATKVVTPSFREIQGDIPDTPVICLDGAPIGAIIQYGAPVSTLDTNWLPCLGQAVSRTLYHELFEKIGTIYGEGDGSTTFNLPNYGGKVPVGIDTNDSDFDTLGVTLGEKTHKLLSSEMPSHSHNLPIAGTSGSSPYLISSYTTANKVLLGATGDAGGNQPHNNIQPSIVANYIIKAKQASTAVLQGTILNTYSNEIDEVYSSFYINSNFSKSYNLVTGGSEVKVGYQIDGKDVYAKRYSLPNLTSGTSVRHGLSNFTLVDWTCLTYYGGVWRKLPYTTSNGIYYTLDVDSTNFSYFGRYDLNGSGEVTLYYIYNS